MKISVIGTGYVGLVTGACLSDFGLNIICLDNNAGKIENLKNGIIPIYEPGLDDMVARNCQYKRLEFTTDVKYAVEAADVIFIAVGTPPAEDGSADLRHVFSVATDIGKFMNGQIVVVDKSTVPIGTGQQVKMIIQDELDKRNEQYEIYVVSNPEFLREGNAIYDFTHPDKVVIGAESDYAIDIMKSVYRVLYINESPFIITNVETAEMIKYANNAYLAMKISFINEIANLCERVGANVQEVAKAIGKDGRIGSKFLHAGPGYGGSCFPKDTMALAYIGRQYDSPIELIETTIKVNNGQKIKAAEKIALAMDGVQGKTLAILGLTFKPKTDDVRDAPAVSIIHELNGKGASFKVFDPEGMHEAQKILSEVDKLTYCTDEYSAIEGCDGVVLVTEWHQFRNLDLQKVKKLLKEPFFFDLRNIYNKHDLVKIGFHYYGTGV